MNDSGEDDAAGTGNLGRSTASTTSDQITTTPVLALNTTGQQPTDRLRKDPGTKVESFGLDEPCPTYLHGFIVAC